MIYCCVLWNSGCEETNFHLFFECAFLANHVGTQSPLLGIWIHSPYTWLLKLEQPLAAHFSERSSLLHAGSFGLQEMEWSLTLAKLISMFGRHNLEKLVYKNMVWCAPKPSNLDKSPSAFGEIAIANFFFLFFFGPSFLVLLCYTFVHLGSLLIQKKKIGRGLPCQLDKKGWNQH